MAPLVAFWLEGVALPVVGGLGFMGNIAAILVLSQQEYQQNKLSFYMQFKFGLLLFEGPWRI